LAYIANLFILLNIGDDSMSNIIGNKYTIGKVKFEILEVESYSIDKVSKQYKEILKFRPGYLVAVSYRGTFIPNITTDSGVARLTKVRVNDEVYNRPGSISSVIGIKEAMYAYEIVES
jgi:hypothetical protein